MRKITTIIPVMSALLVGVGSAIAAPSVPGWRTVGQATASGDFAVAAANGTAAHPSQVAVRIVSSRGGSVTGLAVVACTKNFGIGSSSTNLKGRSPLLTVVRMPMRGAESCDVIASGSSMSGGKLLVQILAK